MYIYIYIYICICTMGFNGNESLTHWIYIYIIGCRTGFSARQIMAVRPFESGGSAGHMGILRRWFHSKNAVFLWNDDPQIMSYWSYQCEFATKSTRFLLEATNQAIKNEQQKLVGFHQGKSLGRAIAWSSYGGALFICCRVAR